MKYFKVAPLALVAALAGIGNAGPIVPYGMDAGRNLRPATAVPVGILPATIPVANILTLQTTLTSLQAQISAIPALSANLTAFDALSSTGFPSRTGTNTWAQRSIAAGSGITVTNGDGVSGNPSIALTNLSITLASGTGLSVAGCSPVSLGGTCTVSLGTELAGVVALASTGIVTRTGSGTYAARTITAGTGIGVTNGDGVAAAPTIAIDATVATLTGAQILTNKTLNCANNTCTVRLASDVTGVLPVANGGRNSGASLGNNQVMVSTAGAIIESTGCSSASTVLVGGSPPACAAVPDAALSVNVDLLASSQTFTGQKTFPAAGSTAVVIPALRQASGGPDITMPTPATGDTLALLSLPQSMSNKTLPSPVLSGTVTGTYLLGGTPTVGTPAATTTQVANAAYAEAQKTGGLVDIALLVGGITNGDYCGPDSAGEGCNATATAITSWSSPVAGTLKNCAIPWSVTVAPGDTNFTLYRAAGGVDAPTFATTTTVVPVGNGHHFGVDGGHIYAVIANDLFVVKTDRTWGNTKFRFVCQFIPTS